MPGQLLFLVYINDISNSSDKLEFYLFADDTILKFCMLIKTFTIKEVWLNE